MRVLISGAGIAGPTLAYWLVQHGFEATLVEKAPRFRTGGYIIDFWGSGYDIAEQMGLVPELETRGYHMREVRLVDRDGRRVGGFEVEAFAAATGGRFISVPRGDLAAAIYGRIAGSVETIFGDDVVGIEDDGREVRVRFARAPARHFDLVIGADGLHSTVRRLVFGAQPELEAYLGYKVAAAELAGYRPRDELVYVLYSPVGFQVGRFAMRGDRTLILFVWTDQDPATPATLAEQRAVLAARFGDGGWECKAILEQLASSGELYFDRVSQIHMPSWTKGRVALVGDAAFCVSLLAGQGSALAMVAAYVLAGELKTHPGDHRAAFESYERRLSSFIAAKQKAAQRLAGSFVPRSAVRAFVRNQATRLLRIPLITRIAFGRGLVDKIELPSY